MLNFKFESWQFGTGQESVYPTHSALCVSPCTWCHGVHVSSAFLQVAHCNPGCMPCLLSTHWHCMHIPTCFALRNKYLTFNSQAQFHPGLGARFLLRSLMNCRPPATQAFWRPPVSGGALQRCSSILTFHSGFQR